MPDSLAFSPSSGAHERQLQRRYQNPLFAPERRGVDAAELEAARARDAAEQAQVMEAFRQLVEQAMGLKPNEESETVLELKARLDQCYAKCAGLGGGQDELLDALRQLTGAIMRAVWAGAGDDALARSELEQEELARAKNQELLRHPLVADLMRPDSPLAGEELVPSLLSESPEAVAAAAWLFSPEQLRQIHAQARELLQQADAGEAGRAQLQALEAQLLAETGAGPGN